MAKSDLLRFQDARDAYRLIGECRDLGGDPALWHRRMFEGLCRVIGAAAVSGGEGRWIRPHRAVEPFSAFGVGFDSRSFELYMAYRRFGVSSRAQLLAHVFRRVGRDGWKQLLPVETARPPGPDP